MIRDLYIKANAPSGGGSVGATLMKTGQTTSYRTGDDGDLESGRATSFLVLASNNPFGNTNRFTDTLGGQTYTNFIRLDWSTFDGATVLGWDFRVNGGGASVNKSWDNAIDEAKVHSVSTFISGWRLPNKKEVESLIDDGLSQALNYVPLSINNSFTYWTGTTPNGISTSAYLYYTQILFGNNFIVLQPKTSTAGYRWHAVRTFTVTGTTLT
jgi:hypothetical protein